jgi:hypothetical protein
MALHRRVDFFFGRDRRQLELLDPV